MSRAAPLGWLALGGGLLAAALFATGSLQRGSVEPEVAAPAAAEADPLALSPADRARTGVRIAALQSSTITSERRGFARAVDVGPLAAIDAERQSAAAAFAASGAELRRLQTLYAADQSASLRSVEAARAQASADRVRLELAARRTGLEFGPGLTRLGTNGLRSLIADVANGRAVLVRIDITGAALVPGQSVRIGEDGAGLRATVLGTTATADAKLQTSGALAIVRGAGASALSVGRIVPASVAGGAQKSGVLVPRSAIVRWHGARWVFRQKDAGFERVELVGGEASTDGWLVIEGLVPGDRIAVEGAGSLLAIEHGGEAEEE